MCRGLFACPGFPLSGCRDTLVPCFHGAKVTGGRDVTDKDADHDELESEMENLTTKVPADVRQAVRLAAVSQRRTVQDVVTEALRDWLERQPGK